MKKLHVALWQKIFRDNTLKILQSLQWKKYNISCREGNISCRERKISCRERNISFNTLTENILNNIFSFVRCIYLVRCIYIFLRTMYLSRTVYILDTIGYIYICPLCIRRRDLDDAYYTRTIITPRTKLFTLSR